MNDHLDLHWLNPIIMICYIIDKKMKCPTHAIKFNTIQICGAILNNYKKKITDVWMGIKKQEISMSCKKYFFVDTQNGSNYVIKANI